MSTPETTAPVHIHLPARAAGADVPLHVKLGEREFTIPLRIHLEPRSEEELRAALDELEGETP